jgi:hypothetical protein
MKGKMKKVLFYVGLPVIVIAIIFYWLYQKSQAAPVNTQSAVATTTGSQTGLWQWFAGWDNYTSAALSNQTSSITGFNSLLSSVSNAFGVNDGGDNPGVSTGGSDAGGSASSGSGVGLPSALSQVQSIFDTAFNQTNYQLSALNNFDVENASASVASTNGTDTGVSGYDNSDMNYGDDD